MEPIPAFTPALFTASEAETISGVDVTLQKVWRQRGHIPARTDDSSSRVRFDVWGLANLLALRLLAGRGSGPLLAREPARACALKLADYIIRDRDGWSGDHGIVGAWNAEWYVRKRQLDRRSAELTATIQEAIAADPPTMSAADVIALAVAFKAEAGPGSGWDAQRHWLLTHLYRARGIDAVPAGRFFVWSVDGSYEFVPDVRLGFEDGLSNYPRFDGLVAVLDLHAVAVSFRERLGRPAMHVQLVHAQNAAPRRVRA